MARVVSGGGLRAVSVLVLLLLGLTASGAFAKDDDDDDDTMSMADKAAERFPQPIRVGALLERAVIEPEESQPVLGHVTEVVRAKDGTVKVVVAYGGFLGFGTRPIAVPVDAMTLLGDYMEIVDLQPKDLAALPSFDGKDAAPLPPDETIKVGLARPPH